MKIEMRRFSLGSILMIPVLVAVAIALFGLVVMLLWNLLMPAIFGLSVITFWQALGLLILSKIFLGSIRYRPRTQSQRARRFFYRDGDDQRQ